MTTSNFKQLLAHPPYRPGGNTPKPELPKPTLAVDSSNADSHELYLLAFNFYEKEYFWEAHEIWESLWRLSFEASTRNFLKALIQIAAGSLKQKMDEREAARRLFESAQKLIESLIDKTEFLNMDLVNLESQLSEILASSTIEKLSMPLLTKPAETD